MRSDRRREVSRALKGAAVRPSKGRGQNFSLDPFVLQSIAEFGDANGDRRLLEIGPGLGALTELLLPRGLEVLIEVEPSLCALLRKRFPQLEVIEQDVRTVDFGGFGPGLTVFGNLPYVFSTDIVFHLVRHRHAIHRAVLLLQKEFVERMAAPPGSRTYGSLSVALQIWADVTSGPTVPGTAFEPATRVESQVVELRFLPEARYDIGDPEHFERVVRGSFRERRKKILNSLGRGSFFAMEVVRRAFEETGIDPNRRAETLSVSEFASLARALRS